MQVVASIEYDRCAQIGAGQGMNSKVFLASDPQLGAQLAVKEIEKGNFVNRIPDYFAEAQTMFASAHPSIVPIQYACQTSTHIALAMPYFPKGSLATRVCRGPMTLMDVIRLAQGILRGIAKIHRSGFVHFDIKPSNVLINDSEDALIADFGQTRRFLAGGVVYAPSMYPRAIPPETWAGGMGSVLSDIYQAGLLLYRAVNGDPWYHRQHSNLADTSALRQSVINGRFPDRKAFLPHVPQRVRSLIRKALNVDPQKRFQSASEMSAALARVPVGLNWRTALSPQGGFVWNADRVGRTALLVELLTNGNSWSVCVWTQQRAVRRAKNYADFWRTELTYQDAIAHLEQVFLSLD